MTSPLFPPPERRRDGNLAVGDHHIIAWAELGNPEGRPVVLLHGGPGSGRSASAPRFFDPALWRIVTFDQRGCGESWPHAGDTLDALEANTTGLLVADMEALRDHLGIQSWTVFGHSWGTTLALAYAEAHPRRTAALLLTGVTTTRQRETDWLYHGMAPLFPEEFARFRAGAPAGTDDSALVAAYYTMLRDPDPTVHRKAQDDFDNWESATVMVRPGAAASERDPRAALGRARICTHYFVNAGFLSEGQLIRDVGRLKGIPCTMVHGRLDLEAPLTTAWEIKQAWPESELVVVPSADHDNAGDAMATEIMAAARRLASG